VIDAKEPAAYATKTDPDFRLNSPGKAERVKRPSTTMSAPDVAEVAVPAPGTVVCVDVAADFGDEELHAVPSTAMTARSPAAF
jgi:hypothetical protein